MPYMSCHYKIWPHEGTKYSLIKVGYFHDANMSW